MEFLKGLLFRTAVTLSVALLPLTAFAAYSVSEQLSVLARFDPPFRGEGRAIDAVRNIVGTTVLASRITYRADGLLTSIVYGNGLTERRAYNLRGELISQTVGDSTFNYAYDPNGNLVQKDGNGLTHLYVYDTLDRLIEETSASVGQLGYRYDPNGNRLSLLDNGEAKACTYSPNTNRLTQVGHKDVVLDAAGNTLSKDGGKWRFEYLPSGRLSKVYKHGKWIATYRYDRRGLRTEKTTKRGTTVYHYDEAGRLIAETAKDGTVRRAYIWLDDLPLVQIDIRKDRDHAWKPRKEHIAYLHTDHLGAPRLATDANQQIVWRWESDAFGAKEPDDLDNDYEQDDHDNKITVNLGPGRTYRDRETGLYYGGARYWDPKTGRSITADPLSVAMHVQKHRTNLGMPGQPLLEINPFVYVLNNPLRFIDPTGLASLDTDIGRGTTTFDPRPEDPNGVPITIPTRTQPDSTSAPGAGDPINTPDVNCLMNVTSEAYGPPGTYIDTGDPRGRDIHGGGTGVPGARGPRQSYLAPTKGCTRGYNDDLRQLCNMINNFKHRNPGVAIPYTRKR